MHAAHAMQSVHCTAVTSQTPQPTSKGVCAANIPPAICPSVTSCQTLDWLRYTYAHAFVPLRDDFFSLCAHMPISTFRLSAAKHFPSVAVAVAAADLVLFLVSSAQSSFTCSPLRCCMLVFY